MVSCTKESGTCEYCREGCTRKPGWFLPGEAEKAAAYLGLTLGEFFAKYLAVDWWQGSPDIFLLSPAVQGELTGTEFPGDPRGTCVFYKDGCCEIHAVKPHECREHWCGAPGTKDTHRQAGLAWTGHQGQIRELLGREPETQPYEDGLAGLLGMILGQ